MIVEDMLGGGMDWRCGIGIYMHTKVYEITGYWGLLYSKENSSQYSVIIYTVKESEKEKKWFQLETEMLYDFL